MGKQAAHGTHAKDAQHLTELLVHLTESLDGCQVECRKRHQEHRDARYLARAHPDEQQHHDARHGDALEGQNERCQQLAYKRASVRKKAERHAQHKRCQKAARNAREREPQDGQEAFTRHDAYQASARVQRACQQDVTTNQKACGLPHSKPECAGRKSFEDSCTGGGIHPLQATPGSRSCRWEARRPRRPGRNQRASAGSPRARTASQRR